MEIIVGKYAGFCNGAKNAVNKTMEALDGNTFYSIGEIVHNEEVINKLKAHGLIVVDSIDSIPSESKVIVRAHGESLKFYQEAKKKNLSLLDLTCGRVKLVHNKILSKKDSFVIIIGKKNHPEAIAHKSYSDFSFVVETFNDIKNAYQEFLTSGKSDVYIVVQTTFNTDLFEKLVDEIKKEFASVNIIVDNTICNATTIRQKEACEIAREVDEMIVIGGGNSSNTKELAIKASKYCKNVYLIRTKNDLNVDMFNKDDIVGITAGASTPKETIDEVIEYLSSLYKRVK